MPENFNFCSIVSWYSKAKRFICHQHTQNILKTHINFEEQKYSLDSIFNALQNFSHSTRNVSLIDRSRKSHIKEGSNIYLKNYRSIKSIFFTEHEHIRLKYICNYTINNLENVIIELIFHCYNVVLIFVCFIALLIFIPLCLYQYKSLFHYSFSRIHVSI